MERLGSISGNWSSGRSRQLINFFYSSLTHCSTLQASRKPDRLFLVNIWYGLKFMLVKFFFRKDTGISKEVHDSLKHILYSFSYRTFFLSELSSILNLKVGWKFTETGVYFLSFPWSCIEWLRKQRWISRGQHLKEDSHFRVDYRNIRFTYG